MNTLLDSDIVIEVLRSKNPTVLAEWGLLADSHSQVSYSPITAAEIWAGARPGEFKQVSAFFHPINCLPCTYEIGELAGMFLRRHGKTHSLEAPDALIAATAVHHHAQLWTRNRKHFPMPELRFYES